MNRRDFLRFLGLGTTSYFVFGSGLWKPKVETLWYNTETMELKLVEIEGLDQFNQIFKEYYIAPIRDLLNRRPLGPPPFIPGMLGRKMYGR